jgi:arylsulfatase A-like enzyme
MAASVILIWSLLDAAWLLYSGVQLQPGILRVIGYSPEEFWPHVQRHLRKRRAMAWPGIGFAMICSGWLIYRVVRPRRPDSDSRRQWTCLLVAGVVLVTMLIGRPYLRAHSGLRFSGEVLDHNSHWYALASRWSQTDSAPTASSGRQVPRAGERRIVLPDQPADEWPNIVLVWMESVSHASTTLPGSQGAATPSLRRLADQGIEFVRTYVPVSQTGKAYWATLTGSTPDIQPDYSEALLADACYENLATILKRVGYRSAFFEMSKGSFQCAPGVFANMGFDWGWWRENLEDPSANLGYLAGDDFRMLDPAFAWATAQDTPFLLTMITSVAHDPFVLPSWYGETPKDRPAAYAKAVEYTDAFVGEVLNRLDALSLTGDTIVCVLGDHGESLRPETKRGRWIPYEEVIRVPWLMRWPGRLAGGQRISWPCSQMDVTPTILRVLGCDIGEAGFDGRDALQPGPQDRRLFFSSWFEDSPEGFLQGRHKIVYWPYTGRLVRFDLDADPGELTPTDITGHEKGAHVEAIADWKAASQMYFAPRRFRERLLFDHWQAFAAGRAAWAFYVPDGRRPHASNRSTQP